MQAMVRKTTTSDTLIGARAALHAGFERIYAGIPRGKGWATYPFNTLTLGSHFQPIFSVAAQSCIGYEGLLRADNLMGQAMKAETVFALSADRQEELFLDWLCRALHLRNFNNLSAPGDMLFLNAYPQAAIEDPHHPQVFATMMEFYGVNPRNVVVEILETGVSDEAQLVDAAKLYRKLGCRIAIDDFGIGYSNFDRLWRLRPDYIKIDRSVTAAAVSETHAKLVFANMVKLIHECGAKVIVEGIETRDEALTALEVGADFLQGFYFARPGLAAVPPALGDFMFTGLLNEQRASDPASMPMQATHVALDLDTYARALNLAILDLQRGTTFARATESFLSMPQVMRICLATADKNDTTTGTVGNRLVLDLIESTSAGVASNAVTNAGTITTANASATATTCTSIDELQDVLQRALSAPHQVHILSKLAPTAPRAAITLSCAFELDQRMVVMCGDLVDRRYRSEMPPLANRNELTTEANVIRLHL